MKKNTYKKEEKLCSKVLFNKAFASKKNFHTGFIRVVWCYADFESQYPCKSAVTVPKKKFRKAVDRNKLKRLLRESFRLNKHIIYDSLIKKEKKIALVLIYNSHTKQKFKDIEEKIILSLQRLQKEIENN